MRLLIVDYSVVWLFVAAVVVAIVMEVAVVAATWLVAKALVDCSKLPEPAVAA